MKAKGILTMALCAALAVLVACGEAPAREDGPAAETPQDPPRRSESTARAAVVERLEDAIEHLDGHALAAIWDPSEHALLEREMLERFNDLQADGGSWTATPGEMKPASGFYTIDFEFVIDPANGEPPHTETRRFALVKIGDDWLLRFQR